MAGEFDAGAADRHRFEASRYKRPGLEELCPFQVTPGVIIARAGLDPQVVNALRQTLVSLNSKREKRLLEKLHGYTIEGYLPVTDSYFDWFRSALTNEVALFRRRNQ